MTNSRFFLFKAKRVVPLIGAIGIAIAILLGLFLLGIKNRVPVYAAAGDIIGTVYRDYDASTTRGTYEPGIEGVIVSAYNDAGTVVSTTTDANGAYTLSHTFADNTVRVEFSLPSTGDLDFLEDGAAGGTSVQFIDISGGTVTNIDATFSNPAQYCQAMGEHNLATSCYVSGDPLLGGSASNLAALVSFPYTSSGTTPSPSQITTTESVGSIWGLAFDQTNNRLYSAAVLRRHSGIGELGYGGLYVTHYSGTIPLTTENFIDLSTLGQSFGTVISRNLPATSTTHSHDPDAFDKVAKTSIGDIDISRDNQHLYVTNLNTQALIDLDISNINSPAINATYPITDDSITCPNGVFRPWAVKVHDGEIYTGGVCSGENGGGQSDLSAYILRLNTTQADNFDIVYTFPLTYDRGVVNGSLAPAEWQPWRSTWEDIDVSGSNVVYPEPVLSDIEFDIDDSIMVGFLDRSGHKLGLWNYSIYITDTNNYNGVVAGDLLRICNVSGTYVLEGGTGCDYNFIASGNQGSEYYHGLNYSVGGHYETGTGGLAHLFGSNQIVTTNYDPFGFNDGGATWLSNTNGADDRRFEIFNGSSGNPTYAGKSNGLGDLELMCHNPAPVEVGNRIWLDADNDGIQDPSETGLANVVVSLTDGTTTVTTTTDSEGHYLFLSTDAGSPLTYNSTYTISVDLTQSAVSTYTLAPLNQTTADTSLPDGVDSDATQSGTSAIIPVTTGNPGDNNHTLDIGMVDVSKDWGDLPDSFDTISATNGANHILTNTLYLGGCVDSETDGLPDAQAGVDGSGGDDNDIGTTVYGGCTDNDDEDGIRFITPLVAGNEACVSVTAVNSTGSAANLYGFIDYNGDGDFDSDTDEPLNGGTNGTTFSSGFANLPNGGVTDASYCFDVPANATFDGGETHFRFRLTSDTLSGDSWAATASNGEVEDYYAQLACAGNYVWLDNGSTANTQDGTDTPLASVTLNLIFDNDGTAGINLGTDAVYTTTTDVNGEYHFCGLISGTYRIDIPNPPTADIVTKDIGGDEDTDSDGSQAGGSGSRVTGDQLTITDANITTQPTGENSTADENGTAGPNNFPDNQVNQQQDFGFSVPYDWGDLPDLSLGYPTLNTNSGPSHAILPGLYMGACVDSESDGVDSAAGSASGDDSAAGTVPTGSGTCSGDDDEDGLTFTTGISGNSGVGICTTFDIAVNGTVPAGADGYLNLWIDLNNDGTLNDASEQVVADNVVDGTLADNSGGNLSFPAGATTSDSVVSINVPCSTALIGEDLYIRARFTQGSGVGADIPTGVASNGEVEDFALPIYGWDFSDAPDSNNQTEMSTAPTIASNDFISSTEGARHLVVDNLALGSCVDGEINGVAATSPADATGDDAAAGTTMVGSCSDDEDGLTSLLASDTNWADGGTISVTVSGVTSNACVYGWVDWDNNGFGVGSDSTATGSASGDGTIALTYSNNLPSSGSFPANSYMRLRVVPGSCGSISAVGSQIGGEVEDYRLRFEPTAITLAHIEANSTAVDPLLIVIAVLFGVLSLVTAMIYGTQPRPSKRDQTR